MDLLKKVKALEHRLPPIKSQSEKEACDVPIICKFFDPTGSWTWYVTEGEKRGDEDYLFFGLVRGFEKELGYFCLSELMEVKGRMGLGIEMDLHFRNLFLSEAQAKQI